VPVEVQLVKAELLVPEVSHLGENSRATHANDLLSVKPPIPVADMTLFDKILP
jgi:hypothetical protein